MARGHIIDAWGEVSWQDFLELCKPRIVALIVFTAMAGMFLAPAQGVPLASALAAMLGIGLAAASAAAFNHVADHRIDALMARTHHRPLPAGQIERRTALCFASLLGAFSMVLLAGFVNVLTAVLTLFSLIGYAIVYTVYLKRATPQNIVIGGAAGAAPPVLGWTAATGSIDPQALLLFLIIFAWTPPHFWSLAIYRWREYASARVPMLPVTHGLRFTRLQILLYTIILFIASLLPFVTYMSGPLYLIGAAPLSSWFLCYAIRMQRDHSERLAIRTFRYSIVYLAGIFLFLFIDRYFLPTTVAFSAG